MQKGRAKKPQLSGFFRQRTGRREKVFTITSQVLYPARPIRQGLYKEKACSGFFML